MSEEISPEQHAADHAAWRELLPELQQLVKYEVERRERWEKIRAQVIGGLILALMGAIGSGLLWLGKTAIESVGKGHGA